MRWASAASALPRAPISIQLPSGRSQHVPASSMSAPYVCTACRHQIALSQSRFLGRYALRWISDSATKRQNERSRGGIGTFFDRTSSNGHSNGHSNSAPRGRYSGKEMRPQQLLTELDKPAQSGTSNPQHNRPPFSIHKDASRQPPQRRSLPAEQPPELKQALKVLFEQTLANDLPRAWSACRRIGRICTQLPLEDTLHVFATRQAMSTFSRLLSLSVRTWLESLRTGVSDPELPSPYQVLLELHSLDGASGTFYRLTLWQITSGVSDLRFEANADNAQAVQRGIEDIIKTWRLCIGGWLTRKSVGRDNTNENRAQFMFVANNDADWSFLPPPDIFTSVSNERRSFQMFEEMLNILVPVQGEENGKPGLIDCDYASSALLTWDLLQTTRYQPKDGPSYPFAEVSSYLPLTSMFDTMLKRAPAPRVPTSLLNKVKSINDPILLQKHQMMLARLNCEALPDSTLQATKASNNYAEASASPAGKNKPRDEERSGSGRPSSANITFVNVPENPQTERFALNQISRLRRALEREDMHQVEKIRREIHAFAVSHQAAADTLPLEVYEHLMLVSLSLRNPKVAIETWNHTVQTGYKPTLKTYTVMLRGAQNSRDILGLQTFWQKMRQAGFKPDAHAWSIRILALLKLRSAPKGLEALGEMGQDWLTAARARFTQEQARGGKKQEATETSVTPSQLVARYPGPIDGVPRPNLEIMNAAIAGLSTAKPEEIPKVFSWGRAYGIEPDLTTYNALLSLAMRNSQASEAISVLRRMRERGIHADSTTWTVLITSLFETGFLNGLNHAEQQEKILSFIDSLNDMDNGLPGMDEKAYALIIDRLTKRYENATAAAAVFSHMIASGRQPTPHIYTILMTSYFQRKPQPDFAAVDALWQHIQDQGRGFSAVVDTTFFDRMIEGYATHHHLVGTKPMEDFLNYARRSGKQPGWQALQSLAQVYAERELWNKLRDLIDDVKILHRENSGRMAKRGEDDFWTYIQSTGIVRGQPSFRQGERGSPLLRAEQQTVRYEY